MRSGVPQPEIRAAAWPDERGGHGPERAKPACRAAFPNSRKLDANHERMISEKLASHKAPFSVPPEFTIQRQKQRAGKNRAEKPIDRQLVERDGERRPCLLADGRRAKPASKRWRGQQRPLRMSRQAQRTKGKASRSRIDNKWPPIIIAHWVMLACYPAPPSPKRSDVTDKGTRERGSPANRASSSIIGDCNAALAPGRPKATAHASPGSFPPLSDPIAAILNLARFCPANAWHWHNREGAGMATGGAGTGKTFEVSYALTDEEIKLLAYVTGQKRARIAPFGHYYVWGFIAGVVLSYSGGAIAHSYYGVPLDLQATALVMALFATFIAGAITYRGWLRSGPAGFRPGNCPGSRRQLICR